MNTQRIRLFAGMLAAWVLASGPPVSAETAKAKKLVEEAVDLRDKGSLDQALELFERAYQLDPAPALLGHMADVWDRKGDLAKARELYERWEAAETDPGLRAKAKARLLDVLGRMALPSAAPATAPMPPAGVCTEEMCRVPAGRFYMGCNGGDGKCPSNVADDQCAQDEYPCHLVTVPEFWIDRTEVTSEAYRMAMGACPAGTGSSDLCTCGKPGKAKHPVNCLTWDEAKAYCEKVGKRLCSEAEWEKAARGTDGRKYPWGNQTATCQYAVMDEEGDGCGTNFTWPVGSKPAGASPYGAMDMAGNVWEWVEDDWHDSYNGAPTDGSAWVDKPRRPGRVYRGGGFGNYAAILRASYRFGAGSSNGDGVVGVRCCKSFR